MMGLNHCATLALTNSNVSPKMQSHLREYSRVPIFLWLDIFMKMFSERVHTGKRLRDNDTQNVVRKMEVKNLSFRKL